MAERRGSGEVLQGLASGAPGDQLLEPALVGPGDRVSSDRRRLHGADAGVQDVGGQQLGIEPGVGHAGSRQVVRRDAQDLGERTGGVGMVRHERHPA
jgi:hypothetical protein